MPTTISVERISMAFMLLVSSLAVLGQFATSIYLPSLPAIGRDLQVPLSSVQFTLTVFLLAYAPTQLIYGPLSDRYGRKPPLLFGLGVFLIGTLICWNASGISVLVAGRVMQGVGSSAAVVICRAMIRDTYSGTHLTQAMAWYTIIFSLAPGFAPIIGGILQSVWSWQATFGATFLYGIVVSVLAIFVVRETHPHRDNHLLWIEVVKLYLPVFGSFKFLVYSLTSALTMGCIYAYFAGMPDMYIGHLGVSTTAFGFFPLITVVGYIMSGIITQQFIHQMTAKRLALLGFSICFLGSAIALTLVTAGGLSIFTMTASVFIFVSGSGVMFAVAVAEALRDFTYNAGAASALLGFLQMLGAALGSFLVSQWGSLGLAAFPFCMFLLSLLSLSIFALSFQKLSSH
ncbi:MAG: multidrug effflux MFS transporter [Runella sp.]